MAEEEIKFIRFVAKHAYSMDWKDKDEFAGLVDGSPQYFHTLEANNGALSVVKGDLVLGILVITPYNPRHCAVSIYMAIGYVTEFDKSLLRVTQRVIDDLSKAYVRVSAEIKNDNEKLEKYMKYLGFGKEGVMRRYGYKGEDYAVYAIITDKEYE